jgi:hypothetical protein
LPPLPPAPVRACLMRELNREEVSLCGRLFPGRSVKPDPARPPAPAARLRRSNGPRHSSRRPRPAMHGATTSHRARPAEGFPPQKRTKVSRFPFPASGGRGAPRRKAERGGFARPAGGENLQSGRRRERRERLQNHNERKGSRRARLWLRKKYCQCAPAPGADLAAGAGGLLHGLNVKSVISMRQNQLFGAA